MHAYSDFGKSTRASRDHLPRTKQERTKKNRCALALYDKRKLPLVDDCQTVTQRQDNLADTRIVRHHAVEGAQTDSLLVAVVGRINNMSVPQGVVSKDESALPHQRKDQLVIRAVLAFVGIDEYEVK